MDRPKHYVVSAWRAAATSMLAVALLGTSSGQVTATAQGYRLRAKYVVGKVSKYIVKSFGGPKGMVVSVTIGMSEKVAEVSNGIGTIEVSLGKSVVMQNGKPVKQFSGAGGQKGSVRLDALGMGVDKSGDAIQTHLEFPSQDIKVGASWTTSAFVPYGQGVQKVTATYRLDGIFSVGGKRVAKLSAYLKGTGAVLVKGSGTAWISVDDGSLIKESIVMNAASKDASAPVTIQVTRS